jgi:Ca2+-binding RTX toxin-like protein
MASQSVTNSTELRDAIQQALPADTITLTSGLSSGIVYDVTTLAKLVCNTPNAVEGSGYVITGGSTSGGVNVRNTRIYQQNIDGPYAPGTVTMTSGNMTLNYTTGGAADGSSLFDSTSGNFTLNNLNFTGTHSGWNGNGGLYMSMRAFNSNTADADFTLSNSTVAITGQGNFNATSTAANAGGSAFLHSWNNTGTVNLTTVNFNESGFLSSFNYGNDSETPKGTYNITGNTFRRGTANTRVVRHEGNRLTNANATLSGNTFTQGSYLDLYGNTGSVKFAGSNNNFTTIAGGSGIRVTAQTGVTTNNPVVEAGAAFSFTGPGLALSYVNAAAGTVRLDTLASSGGRSISVGGVNYDELIAGGQAADSISASGTNRPVWINADAGNDTVAGTTGNDFILGGTGNDSISAGGGSDTIDAGDDNDTVSGANGSDSIAGGSGNDYLDAGGDIDTISGGNGIDTLIGGFGDDSLTGGADSDMFQWFNGDGIDRITDFTSGSGAGNDQFALPDIFANTAGGSTLNAADFTTEATLSNLAAADNMKIVKITNGQTTEEIEAEGAYEAVGAYVLVFNTDTNFAQLWFDNDWSSNSGERTQLATFSNITSASGLSGFVNSNFFANA